MSKIQCVRRIQFCSGHRIVGHEGGCSNLHGHNYVAFFHAEATSLDSIGRVIDFSVLKDRLGGWIDQNWDHTFIAHIEDTFTRVSLERLKSECGVGNRDVFVLPTNPTAENMASYLLHTVCPKELAATGVIVTKIVLWETENCFAEVTL